MAEDSLLEEGVMDQPVISVSELTFEYPTKRALSGVSFEIQAGSITALVGPNGAGKTTLLYCLAALASPYHGTVHVLGLNTSQAPRAIHRHVGYLPDFFGLYDELTVSQSLIYMALARDVRASEAESYAMQTASDVGLGDYFHSKAGSLSRGLRQRLAIGQAIIHQPPVLLLDEPASGLDPEARASLSSLLLSLRERGMTIMVSSHILTELEDYSTDMLIIDNGTIKSHKPIRAERPEHERKICIRLSSELERGAQLLSEFPGVVSFERSDRELTVTFQGGEQAAHKLLRAMIESDLPVYHFAEGQDSMQEVYLAEMNMRKSE